MSERTLARIRDIRARGEEALQSRSFPLFKGFAETLALRFITALRFTHETKKRIQEALLNRLHAREGPGTEFSMAMRDFPLHCTVLEGEAEQGDSMFSVRILNDDTHERVLDSLYRMRVVYDHCTFDAEGNILLLASEIPKEILDARARLATLYEGQGLKTLPLADMLHTTLARTKSLSLDPREFQATLVQLQNQLSLKPIQAEVSGTYSGKTLEILRIPR